MGWNEVLGWIRNDAISALELYAMLVLEGMQAGVSWNLILNKEENFRKRVDGRHAYPAYHMNKKHWYTIFLNDLVPDDEIIGMVEKSYELVNQ